MVCWTVVIGSSDGSILDICKGTVCVVIELSSISSTMEMRSG